MRIAAFIGIILLTSCVKEVQQPEKQTYDDFVTGSNGSGRWSLSANELEQENVTADSVDIVYGYGPDWLGGTDTLRLDLYYPNQVKSEYPLVIMFHGGGFLHGDKSTCKRDANILAKNGFLVAAIEYRMGWTKGSPVCESSILQWSNAVYRAVQDGNKALNFLVANSIYYKVDIDNIFIEGSSAGAELALNVAYSDADSLNKYLPAKTYTGSLNNTNTYRIKGVASKWGALLNSSIITQSNAKPTIFFHGALDKTIPYDTGHFYSCESFPIDYGSKALNTRLQTFGIQTEIYIDPNGGHSVYDNAFTENHIADFFKSVLN